MDSACLSGRMFDSRSRRPGFGAMVFLVGVLLGRSHQSPSIVLLKSRKCINNVILRPDRSEIMLEAEYRAVYSINQSASKNLGQSISNQSHYSSLRLHSSLAIPLLHVLGHSELIELGRVHSFFIKPLILVLLPLPYLCGWQFIFLDLDGFTYSEIPFFRPSLILGTNLLTLILPFGKNMENELFWNLLSISF